MKMLLKNLKKNTGYLNYGREIILKWVKLTLQQSKLNHIKILDLGCGPEGDLINIQNHINSKNLQLYGIETYEPYIDILKSKNIKVIQLDIEKEIIPVKNNSVDIVIGNQILEHTKDIFWICSEVLRVLKPGGVFIVGIPNLAALHNRILLLFGAQPACIKPLSAHVRGFTKDGFLQFIMKGGYFTLCNFAGSNFYPFPPQISKFLSKIFPTFSVCIFFLLERTKKRGNFIKILREEKFETNYFQGPKKIKNANK